MFASLRNFARALAPYGLIARRRHRIQMKRLGLNGSRELADAIRICRYELWPAALRRPETPWILVDVGANEGCFVRAVQMLTPPAAVYAFEPQNECQGPLEAALAATARGVIFKMVASDRAGETEFACMCDNKLSSVLKPIPGIERNYRAVDFEIKERIRTPTARLDDTLPSHVPIGLIKIDAQGYELPVLKGAAETLKRTTALLLEMNYVPHYEGAATFDDIHTYMRNSGFATFGVSEPYLGPDGPLWADVMFVNQNA